MTLKLTLEGHFRGGESEKTTIFHFGVPFPFGTWNLFLLKNFFSKTFVREAEVQHGPEREFKMTEVVVPVVEVTSTEPLSQMIGNGLIAANVSGVPIQNGLTTFNTHVIAATG